MPRFEIIDQISLGGFRDKANEDRIGASAGHAWVIDGATGLGQPFMGAGSDAAWLAQRSHEAFMRHAGLAEPDQVVAEATEDLIAGFEAERTRPLEQAWELPCGAFLMASLTETGARLTWSGDCRALAQASGGPVMAFGATALSEEAEAELVATAGGGGDPARRYEQPNALAELRRLRGIALAEGRSVILSPDRGFLSHLARAEVTGTEMDLLLMTDGFAAAELRYGLYSGPGALLSAVRRDGLAEVARMLRRFEVETDPEGRLKPRWKRSDDASALWLRMRS